MEIIINMSSGGKANLSKVFSELERRIHTKDVGSLYSDITLLDYKDWIKEYDNTIHVKKKNF